MGLKQALIPPALYTLIDQRQFDEALRRVRSHPQEANYHCDDENTNTNNRRKSVSRRPRSLLASASAQSTSASSSASSSSLLLQKQPRASWPPLHVACSKSAPAELVEALIQACPHALSIKVGKHGETPLHLAALKCFCFDDDVDGQGRGREQDCDKESESESIQILRLLLDSNFGLIDEREQAGGYTVVERLWRKLLHVAHNQYLEHRMQLQIERIRNAELRNAGGDMGVGDMGFLDDVNEHNNHNDNEQDSGIDEEFPTLESFLPQLCKQILLQDSDSDDSHNHHHHHHNHNHPLYHKQLRPWWNHLCYLLKVQHYRTTEDPHPYEDEDDDYYDGEYADDDDGGPTTGDETGGSCSGWSTLHAAVNQADTLYSDLVQCVMIMELKQHTTTRITTTSCTGTRDRTRTRTRNNGNNVLHMLLDHCPSSLQGELNSVGDPTPSIDANVNVMVNLLLSSSQSSDVVDLGSAITSSTSTTMATTMARQCNHEGELPLHVALRNGIPWDRGVQALVRAYPESLTIHIHKRKRPLDDCDDGDGSLIHMHMHKMAALALQCGSSSSLADCLEGNTAKASNDVVCCDVFPFILAATEPSTTMDTLYQLILACPSALTLL
jgi:hypothetical protein